MVAIGRRVLGYAGTALLLVGPAAPAMGQCSDLLFGADSPTPARQQIEPIDLLRLRDFGGYGHVGAPPPFGLSPDRARAAVALRRADPGANHYCIGIVVVALDRSARPLLLDSFVDRDAAPHVGADQNSANDFASSIVPRWSPDGTMLGYLRRVGGVSQLWIVQSDGTGARQITHVEHGVDDFAWSLAAGGVIYSTASALSAARAAIEEEGRRGFHYDERFVPYASVRPSLPQVERDYYRVDIQSGSTRPATPPERVLVTQRPTTETNAIERDARNALGDTAQIRFDGAERWFWRNRLHVSLRNGDEVVCPNAACEGVVDAWWSRGATDLFFLRRDAPLRGRVAMFRWNVRDGSPEMVFATDDLLFGCQSVNDDLLCAHEGPTSPRRLVKLDPTTGELLPVFDPNPETRNWAFGTVERIRWTNEFGNEAFGDLVLPRDRQPGQRHPLIVVGYQSRGFLRGGSGGDYPIHAFAGRGYAVLSFDRPRDTGIQSNPESFVELERSNLNEWADRRNVHSSLLVGIDVLRGRGLIDGDRVGLTGFSEGSAIALWAIFHSKIASVAAISSCCMGPHSFAVGGYSYADYFRAVGFPMLGTSTDEFWRHLSLEGNLATLDVPIMIQIPDSELPFALPALGAARELGAPVEAYVFPGEGHTKSQPSHRLAAQDRAIDWFDFWLLHRVSDHPSRREEYVRWYSLMSDGGSVGETRR